MRKDKIIYIAYKKNKHKTQKEQSKLNEKIILFTYLLIDSIDTNIYPEYVLES